MYLTEMKNLIDEIKKTAKLPLVTILFIIDSVIIFGNINISKYFEFIPVYIKNDLYCCVDYVNSRMLCIMLFLAVMATLVLTLGKFGIPEGEATKYTNGTESMLNSVSAFRRIINIMIWFVLKGWVYCITILLICDKAINFQGENIQLTMLFWINVLYTLLIVLQKLYNCTTKTYRDIVYIKDNIRYESKYIVIAEKGDNNTNYFIVKDKFQESPKFYVVKEIYTKKIEDGENKENRLYETLNSTYNFEEAKFCFENQ